MVKQPQSYDNNNNLLVWEQPRWAGTKQKHLLATYLYGYYSVSLMFCIDYDVYHCLCSADEPHGLLFPCLCPGFLWSSSRSHTLSSKKLSVTRWEFGTASQAQSPLPPGMQPASLVTRLSCLTAPTSSDSIHAGPLCYPPTNQWLYSSNTCSAFWREEHETVSQMDIWHVIGSFIWRHDVIHKTRST